MKRAALDYVARGFAVVPCFPRSKAPAAKGGLKDAVSDADGVDRLWTRAGYNLAVATGGVPGVFVLDVDGEPGRQALVALEQEHGALPETLTNITQNGWHLYFRHPGRSIRNSQARLGPGLDVRGDGAAMLPPSAHPSGHRYGWRDPAAQIAPAPPWLVRLATEERERVGPRRVCGPASSDRDRWLEAEVRRMLDVLDPSMPRQDWVRVGMALHAGGHPFAMFDQWSAGSADKYDARDCAVQWRSFKDGAITMGTLHATARRQGWEPEWPTRPK